MKRTLALYRSGKAVRGMFGTFVAFVITLKVIHENTNGSKVVHEDDYVMDCEEEPWVVNNCGGLKR